LKGKFKRGRNPLILEYVLFPTLPPIEVRPLSTPFNGGRGNPPLPKGEKMLTFSLPLGGWGKKGFSPSLKGGGWEKI
jgi:hypothetical protein